MKTLLSLLLLSATLFVAGCKTVDAEKTVAGTIMTVDAAMAAWAQYVVDREQEYVRIDDPAQRVIKFADLQVRRLEVDHRHQQFVKLVTPIFDKLQPASAELSSAATKLLNLINFSR